MAAAARAAGVAVVTGDTKVVERGKCDGLYVTTTGVGVVPEGVTISADRARPGDRVLISGTIGDHGVAVMSLRENLRFESQVLSDTAALHGLVAAMLEATPDLHVLRDPTRGGLATTLNEIAQVSQVGIRIREATIPVRPQVAAACELLGLDPLYVANEGKLVAVVAPDDADPVLAGLGESFTAFTTHGDTVTELPPGAERTASNEYGVHGFRVGHAFGVQFHPEYDVESARRVTKTKEFLGEDRIERVLDGITEENYAKACETKRLFDNFTDYVRDVKGSRPERASD